MGVTGKELHFCGTNETNDLLYSLVGDDNLGEEKKAIRSESEHCKKKTRYVSVKRKPRGRTLLGWLSPESFCHCIVIVDVSLLHL